MTNKTPNRLLAFLAVEIYGKNPYNRVSNGPYGMGVYLQADPRNSTKGLESPAELIVFLVDHTKGEVLTRKGLVVAADMGSIKEIARIPFEKLNLKEPLTPQIQNFLPKPVNVRQLEKSFKGTILSILSKRKRRKKHRLQLPLRTQLDYGIPR